MTEYASLNGTRIVSGRICIPNYGLWTADVRLAAAPVLPTSAGGVNVVAADLSLVGTVLRQGLYGGVTSARLVGGYAGWRKTLTPRGYYYAGGIPLAMVLGDAATELGERISVTVPATLNASYARPAMPGSYVLGQLGTPLWWMRGDGVTVVGPRSSAAITSTFQALDYEPEAARVTVSADSLADFAPGRLFTAPTLGTLSPISYVEHVLTPTRARTEVLCQ